MRWTLTIVLVLLVSGCFGGGSDDPSDDPTTPATQNPAGEPPMDPAEAAAPSWTPGDWWRWEVSGRSFEAFELTTVVARATVDGYHLASADLPESLRAHILHVPPQGPVSMPDFGWYIHGEDVALIEFPLHDGKTWTGSLEGDALELSATADFRDGRIVYVVNSTYTEFDGQGPRYAYDPAVGMFSELHLHYGGSTPFSSARLVDSGTEYEGDVRLPTPRDKFLAGAGGPPATTAPHGVFTSPSEKEWLVFACYLGGETGSYGITFVTPSANEDPLRCSFQNDDASFDGDVETLWRSSVPGEWNVVFEVVGNGYATGEVIGVTETRCHLGASPSDVAPCN